MLLEDKVAVIHGAGGAIGGAVARSFAREGARVFLCGRDARRLDAVAAAIADVGGDAETALVDALDEQAVGEHLDAVVARAGAIDVALNATGPGPARERTPLARMDVGAFAEPIAFYTRANFITATAAARHMADRGAGVIVTLTALPARLPAPMIGGAAPAWAAVEAFSRSLALELGPAGIRVVCLRAHAIPETPTIAANFASAARAAGVSPEQFRARLEHGTLLKRLPALAEIADTAAFVASDGAGALTASVVNLSAGALAD
jgi:NAD(P)-dependent dehydrogenase (short-subunit alcohol dehydrogenase family)